MLVSAFTAAETSGWELKDKNRRPLPPHSNAPLTIAPTIFAVHDKGLHWLMMANHGEFSNPDNRPAGPPTSYAPESSQRNSELEYPGGSATVFLFSGGLWVGAIKNGERIVSTVVDGDNGTREFGPLEFGPVGSQPPIAWLYQSKGIARKEVDDDRDWTSADDLDGNGQPSADWDGPTRDANGDGNFVYDPEPHIDEDPVGDISFDFLDNDSDGLIDANDPNRDGDLVPGSRDDDGDGRQDEDTLARASQEWITAYVDTCQTCLEAPDIDGFRPLGIRVVQHSYQWVESLADDFLIVDYLVTNIGNDLLQNVWLATFFDFDVGHMTQSGPRRSEDDITFFIDSLQTAIGGDKDTDGGLLAAQFFGVRVLQTPNPNISVSYLNFERLGGDPNDNVEKYLKMSGGVRDPDQFNVADWRFLFSFGPLGDLAPGQTLPVTIAMVNGLDLNAIVENSRQALAFFQSSGIGVSVEDKNVAEPSLTFHLKQNYPNPFNPATTIRYSLAKPGHVTLKIYDLLGQEAATLVSKKQPAGKYEIQWNPVGLPSGVYISRLRAGEFVGVKKLLLLK